MNARIFLLTVPAVVPASVFGDIITLNLLDAIGSAGQSFIAGSPYTVSGVTFTASAFSTFPSMTGVYSANSSTAGVDSNGVVLVDGDSASQLDAGESLVFTLSFNDSLLAVTLASMDFSGVGPGNSDAAVVTTNALGVVELFTGEADFNGTTDVWAPAASYFLRATRSQ